MTEIEIMGGSHLRRRSVFVKVVFRKFHKNNYSVVS